MLEGMILDRNETFFSYLGKSISHAWQLSSILASPQAALDVWAICQKIPLNSKSFTPGFS